MYVLRDNEIFYFNNKYDINICILIEVLNKTCMHISLNLNA